MAEIKRKMKTMELWKKLLIISAVMLLIRVGTVIPIPFVSKDYLSQAFPALGGSFMSTLLGGSTDTMSLFALSISPYITGSIVIQMMTVVIPPLEQLQKDGTVGQEKYKKIVNVTGIAFSFVQALLMAWGLGSRGLLDPYNAGTVILATVIWTVGAIVLIVVGEFLDNFQLGSGISMILFCNIVSQIPSDASRLYEMFIANKSIPFMILNGTIILAIFIAAVTCAVVLLSAYKNIPIRMSGKIAGISPVQDMPIPLVTCSIMPYIFASTLFSMPAIFAMFIPALNDGIPGKIVASLTSSNWFLINHPVRSLGVVLFVLLTYFFTLFYIDFSFNPAEIANNLKKQGAFIPGVRPGQPTAERLSKIIKAVATWGNTLVVALILVLVAVCNISGIGSLSLSGTSLIIAVSVINDMYSRIKAENKAAAKIRQSSYRGILIKKGAKV